MLRRGGRYGACSQTSVHGPCSRTRTAHVASSRGRSAQPCAPVSNHQLMRPVRWVRAGGPRCVEGGDGRAVARQASAASAAAERASGRAYLADAAPALCLACGLASRIRWPRTRGRRPTGHSPLGGSRACMRRCPWNARQGCTTGDIPTIHRAMAANRNRTEPAGSPAQTLPLETHPPIAFRRSARPSSGVCLLGNGGDDLRGDGLRSRVLLRPVAHQAAHHVAGVPD